MTAHDPRVTLTEAETRRLTDAFANSTRAPDHLAFLARDVVEEIIAARLAPIRALADDEAIVRALYRQSGLREDLIDLCAAPVARALRAALDAPVSASQDHDGAEGQGEGERAGEGDLCAHEWVIDRPESDTWQCIDCDHEGAGIR